MILVANFFKKSSLFLLFFLGACSNNNEVLSISGETFGTFYDIKFEKSQYNIKKINDEINNIFISINQCCSTYKNDSLVSFKRDSKNTDLFKEEVKNYFQEVIKISEKANKTVEGFILFDDYDYFNAVAKGYAVDIVSTKFKELNIEDFFINIGGEIRVEGMKNKSFWKIGIENPEKNKNAVKFDKVSFDEAITKNLKIMDSTAFTLSKENKLPIIVFDMNKTGNLKKIMQGKIVGTKVN